MYIFFYTGDIFDLYEITFLWGNTSFVKLLGDPFQEEFKELLFDDTDRNNFGSRASIPSENFSCL